MKVLGGFSLSLLVLSVTSLLYLTKPFVMGFEYGMKKGWVKLPKR